MTYPPLLRKHGWLLVVMLVVAPLLYGWTWSNQIGELGSDATDYLVMARHYSPFEATNRADSETAALTRFPPIYPMLLGCLGGASNLHVAHLITTSLFLCALVVLYFWLLDEGLETAPAALFVLCFACLPDSWMAGLVLHSEYLYLLLSLLAVRLLCQNRDAATSELLLAASLMVTLAALTRTIGVALLVPLAVESTRSRRKHGLIAMLVFAGIFLSWHGLHRADQSYARALQTIYGNKPLLALSTQAATQLQAYRLALHDNFAGKLLPTVLADLLGILCVAATCWRARSLRPDALYLVAYVAVLLVWPYPEVARRLLWPVLPLLIAQPMLLLAQMPQGSRWNIASVPASAAIAAMILLPGLPSLGLAADRYRDASNGALPDAAHFEGWYNPDPVHARHRVQSQLVTIEALAAIPAYVPENDCVIAARPVIVTYFARRRAVFPPLNSVPDPYFMQILRASGCHYVFMYSGADGHFPVPLHPLQRLPAGIQILDRHEEADPPAGEGRMICLLARID